MLGLIPVGSVEITSPNSPNDYPLHWVALGLFIPCQERKQRHWLKPLWQKNLEIVDSLIIMMELISYQDCLMSSFNGLYLLTLRSHIMHVCGKHHLHLHWKSYNLLLVISYNKSVPLQAAQSIINMCDKHDIAFTGSWPPTQSQLLSFSPWFYIMLPLVNTLILSFPKD